MKELTNVLRRLSDTDIKSELKRQQAYVKAGLGSDVKKLDTYGLNEEFSRRFPTGWAIHQRNLDHWMKKQREYPLIERTDLFLKPEEAEKVIGKCFVRVPFPLEDLALWGFNSGEGRALFLKNFSSHLLTPA